MGKTAFWYEGFWRWQAVGREVLCWENIIDSDRKEPFRAEFKDLTSRQGKQLYTHPAKMYGSKSALGDGNAPTSKGIDVPTVCSPRSVIHSASCFSIHPHHA